MRTAIKKMNDDTNESNESEGETVGPAPVVTPALAPIPPTSSLPPSLDDVLGRGSYGRLAERTGFTRKHVSTVLRGKSGASFVAAQRIADAAGVSVDELREYIKAQGRTNDRDRAED